MTLESLERLGQLLPQGAAELLTNEWEKDDGAVKVLVDASQCELWTRQGPILLRMGALEGARALFEQAHSLWEDAPHNEHIQVLCKTPQAKRILQPSRSAN